MHVVHSVVWRTLRPANELDPLVGLACARSEDGADMLTSDKLASYLSDGKLDSTRTIISVA